MGYVKNFAEASSSKKRKLNLKATSAEISRNKYSLTNNKNRENVAELQVYSLWN